MKVLKRKEFARWQLREDLPDALLCEAITEMEAGLIDAELGGHHLKSASHDPVEVKVADNGRFSRHASVIVTFSFWAFQRMKEPTFLTMRLKPCSSQVRFF